MINGPETLREVRMQLVETGGRTSQEVGGQIRLSGLFQRVV